jgi:CheY-like chemotaxis protein
VKLGDQTAAVLSELDTTASRTQQLHSAWLLAHGEQQTSTVLVAEDDPTFRDAVCRFLSKKDFTVLGASTYAEALQLWRDHYRCIDVLVTDVYGVDGLELAEAVESDCPEKPIVFMTADSAALPTPPHPILRKPFRLDDLVAAIRRALGQE